MTFDRLVLTGFTLCLLAKPASAASLKCGQSLVSDGDSTLKVAARCGEPASKRTRKIVVRQRLWRGQEVFVEKELEEWIYPGSSNRFEQRVLFEDGRLVDVQSGDYGP